MKGFLYPGRDCEVAKMGHVEHKKQAPRTVSCAVLVISDTRTEKTDESGRLIMQTLKENGHQVVDYDVLKNDAGLIGGKLDALLDRDGLQVIITSGGTGVSRMDITIETVLPVLKKRLDGFGELFRYLTYQEIGTASIMSRALAGVARGKVIICLPGSLAAVRMAMEKIILPEVGHMVREAGR
ncbi:MAG: molybdenum cofactor biosynthesis protein MoaB [Dehalococcoidales bacterium]|nr:molybdenum cofactor biosynthesis protein MoaB [Dehalococcoidales bacterium]